MTAGNRRVAVVGVALSDCGRVDGATAYALHAQAARRALADAGLGREVVDGFASAGLGVLAPVEVAEYLGLRPTWVDSTSVGGATWEVMAAHAADAIARGHANAVLLVYGSTARADIRATPGWLGEQLRLNSAGTTALVDRLERLGLVRRSRDTADRRRVLLEVEDKARQLGWDFFGPLIDEVVAAAEGLDEGELEAVRRFLTSVLASAARARTD